MNITAISGYGSSAQIQTEFGEIGVTDLNIGDRIATISGEYQPIIWLGKQIVSSKDFPPQDILPITFRRGSIDDDVPYCDLVVSPGHLIHFAGSLVRAGDLVNGTTIVQDEKVDSFTYYHLELERHTIISANGAEAESHLNRGNGQNFAVSDPSEAYSSATPSLKSQCLPELETGEPLTKIRETIQERAEAAGYRFSREPDVRLVVDGNELEPIGTSGGVYSFRVSSFTEDPMLISRSSIAAAAIASSQDRRRLGIALSNIVVRGNGIKIDVAHDYPLLADGFYDAEETHRWTDGYAKIPSHLLRSIDGEITIELHVFGTVPYLIERPQIDDASGHALVAA